MSLFDNQQLELNTKTLNATVSVNFGRSHVTWWHIYKDIILSQKTMYRLEPAIRNLHKKVLEMVKTIDICNISDRQMLEKIKPLYCHPERLHLRMSMIEQPAPMLIIKVWVKSDPRKKRPYDINCLNITYDFKDVSVDLQQTISDILKTIIDNQSK